MLRRVVVPSVAAVAPRRCFAAAAATTAPTFARAAMVTLPNFFHSKHKQPVMSSETLNKDSLIDVARVISKEEATWPHPLGHDRWDLGDMAKVHPTHKPTNGVVDKMALGAVKLLRSGFDYFSGYKSGPLTEHTILVRVCFLETIAGVPGMVAGMIRHMTSLRRMRRDHGWIHQLLEEAENERQHLLTFLELRKPSFAFRAMVLVSQGIFFNLFFLAYLVSPRFCHRLVGYIEEEAVHTYTRIIAEIDAGKVFQNKNAPPIAISYWRLNADATMRDLFVAVRADEAGHKLVNHTYADMHASGLQDSTNPFLVVKRQEEAMAEKAAAEQAAAADKAADEKAAAEKQAEAKAAGAKPADAKPEAKADATADATQKKP